MRPNTNNILKAFVLIYFVLLILVLGHIYFYTDMQDFLNADRDAAERDYAEGWTINTGATVKIDEISAGEMGGSYVATKTLPETMLETDSVYFSTSNLDFKVYVNDEEIYSFKTKENLTGIGDGISYHMIGLGTKDEGDVIRIEARTAFADGTGGRINEMQFGSEELYRHAVMRHNVTGFNLSVLLGLYATQN